MLDEMPARIWHEWLIYFELHPFGTDDIELSKRADWRAAMQAVNIRNVHRTKKSRRAKIDHFLPRYDRPKRKQTPDEMWQAVLAHERLLNSRLGD